MEKTVKQTRGTVGERQIAYVNALKAVDREKRMQQMVKAVFDWLKPDNNDVEPITNAE
jgi:hypothetical protein